MKKNLAVARAKFRVHFSIRATSGFCFFDPAALSLAGSNVFMDVIRDRRRTKVAFKRHVNIQKLPWLASGMRFRRITGTR